MAMADEVKALDPADRMRPVLNGRLRRIQERYTSKVEGLVRSRAVPKSSQAIAEAVLSGISRMEVLLTHLVDAARVTAHMPALVVDSPSEDETDFDSDQGSDEEGLGRGDDGDEPGDDPGPSRARGLGSPRGGYEPSEGRASDDDDYLNAQLEVVTPPNEPGGDTEMAG